MQTDTRQTKRVSVMQRSKLVGTELVLKSWQIVFSLSLVVTSTDT